MGYSAILFGDAFRRAGGQAYYSLERNPEFGAVISSLVDLAGLGDIVKVVIGPSDQSLRRLHGNRLLSKVDLMFLDHYKPAYLFDLKLSEELQLVQPGTVLAADNVIKPGNPPYLEYVRSTTADKKAALAANGKVDVDFDDRYSKQYEKREGKAKLDEDVKGNPSLVYKSELINSFEPTGVPVCATLAPNAGVTWILMTLAGRHRSHQMRRQGMTGQGDATMEPVTTSYEYANVTMMLSIAMQIRRMNWSIKSISTKRHGTPKAFSLHFIPHAARTPMCQPFESHLFPKLPTCETFHSAFALLPLRNAILPKCSVRVQRESENGSSEKDVLTRVHWRLQRGPERGGEA